MVLSNFVLLHSFFIPILFLEIRQLERSEPVFVKTRSKPSEKIHKLVQHQITQRRSKIIDEQLDEVNSLDDPGENFTDNVNAYNADSLVPLRIRMMGAWAHSLIIQKISMAAFIAWVVSVIYHEWKLLDWGLFTQNNFVF